MADELIKGLISNKWATDALKNVATSRIRKNVQEYAQTWKRWEVTPSNHGTECGICNIPLWKGDKVRDLNPGCNHVFHYSCIYRYAQRKSPHCPTCEKKICPKISGLTDNVEIDPLSQFL